mgnify:CR=1 FL=1
MIRWYDYIAISLMSIVMLPCILTILPPSINLNALLVFIGLNAVWEMYCDKRLSVEKK